MKQHWKFVPYSDGSGYYFLYRRNWFFLWHLEAIRMTFEDICNFTGMKKCVSNINVTMDFS